eukprot:gnl/Trimastix_PCT/1033.p1 GENE.gnl/Trimastix_PCT/1033~~gnl/Trimastix_PCT/1033.p1  ORF type:complete len:545 (+),score=214.62 gnl/Trimastix_PCT/1033:66-1700(+)
MNPNARYAQSAFVDEYGQPYIILKEQDKRERVRGIEALKANILASSSLTHTLRTSLGPRGMDKALVNRDGEVTVSNDGATILEQMEVEHPAARLIVDLSKSLDNDIGDGTTGVVVMAGAILEQIPALLDKGIHPTRIADGLERAAMEAARHLETIADRIEFTKENTAPLLQPAFTSLSSKLVNKCGDQFSRIAVDTVCSVADFERRDVNLDYIRLETKVGGKLEDSQLVKGLVIDKGMSHPQMAKTIEDARLAILTCPFECPKPKTKYGLEILTPEEYRELAEMEQKYYRDMVKLCKDCGANLIICQWGFDDEANYLLMREQLPSVRWVGGMEIEAIAMATNGRIVPRFEDLSPEKLGHAGLVRELTFGTENQEMLSIERCPCTNITTVLIRGGTRMICDEAKRSLHDAICVTRNLIRDNRIVFGGGSAEIACSLRLAGLVDTVPGVDSFCYRAFADALEAIPVALAENSGLPGIETLTQIKAAQVRESNPVLGVDCTEKGTSNMREQGVFETLIGKRQQLMLATQMVRMILKIDDIIRPSADE